MSVVATCKSLCARSDKALATAISSPIFVTLRSTGLRRALPWPDRWLPAPMSRRASVCVSPSSSATDRDTDQSAASFMTQDTSPDLAGHYAPRLPLFVTPLPLIPAQQAANRHLRRLRSGSIHLTRV